MSTTERRVVDLDPGELGIVITSSGESGALDPVIAIAGEIDAATAPRLVGALHGVAAGRPTTITVDLTSVTFMDSSGANALVELSTLATTWRGTVVVRGAAHHVRRVCDLTRIEETDGLVLH